MPILVAQPPNPDKAKQLVNAAILRAAGSGAPGQAVAVADASTLNISLCQKVYSISAGDLTQVQNLNSAVLVAWRFMINNDQTPVADIELFCDPQGQNLTFGSLSVGPLVAGTRAAVQHAEQLPVVQNSTYELRLLRSSEVGATAVWLKDLVGTNDLLLPIFAAGAAISDTAPPGTTQFSAPGGAAIFEGPSSLAQWLLRHKQLAINALSNDTNPRNQPMPPTTPPLKTPPPPPPIGGTPTSPGGIATPTPTPTGASALVFNRQNFIKNYAALTMKNWTDPSFIQKLLADPVGVLTANGIPTIAGSVVRVVRMEITGLGHIEEQVDAWIKGNRTGLYDLFMPNLPAGANLQGDGSGGGDVCCCCCPCCSCT